MRAALAACLVVALLAAGAPAAAQLPSTIQTLLEKPELRPFIEKVGACGGRGLVGWAGRQGACMRGSQPAGGSCGWLLLPRRLV